MAGELVPLSSSVEEQYQQLAPRVELSIIYNTHATAEDALQSTSHVPDDSVVFLEGFSSAPHGRADFERELIVLNHYQLTEGLASDNYRQLKHSLLTDLTEAATDYVPEGSRDFGLHNLARLQALLGKDCLVFYADHQDISSEAGAQFNETFHEFARHIGNTALPFIARGSGIGRAMNSFRDSVLGEVLAHTSREWQASYRLVNLATKLLDYYDISSLRHTAEGKLALYLLYGSAHEKSLTWQFSSRGLVPHITELHPLSEELYLDTADQLKGAASNFSRRLGYVALRSLAFDFWEAEDAVAVSAATYPNLQFLNDATADEFRSFMVTCALIRREEDRDIDNAFRWFNSLLRSFMPNPQDFIA